MRHCAHGSYHDRNAHRLGYRTERAPPATEWTLWMVADEVADRIGDDRSGRAGFNRRVQSPRPVSLSCVGRASMRDSNSARSRASESSWSARRLSSGALRVWSYTVPSRWRLARGRSRGQARALTAPSTATAAMPLGLIPCGCERFLSGRGCATGCRLGAP